MSRRLRWFLGPLAGVLVVVLIVVGLSYVASSQADSDGDGLADHVEASGWRTVGGNTFTTDPHAADTDGDGLTDGDEAGRVVSDPGASTLYAGNSNPTKGDSDDDDLDDNAETSGWLSTRGAVYRTDPMDPDTDDDGLTDGEEAGQAVSDPDTGVEFVVFSSPLMSDTDGDGLSDAAEADLSLDAFDRDSDGDEVEDGREVEYLGTAPDVADTDCDGLDDGYEVKNQESQGLDPLSADVKVEPATYAREFAQGAFVGEIVPGDSLAWLVGNLASGSSSFIPGVGWVIGGAADLRDAIGSGIHADWVGAGFSVVGMAPAIGDAAAIPAKTAKFVLRHPELAPAVGAAIVALKWVPDDIKVATVAQVTPNWAYLMAAGSSEKSLLRLQEGRVGLDSLAEAMKRPGHVNVNSGRAGFFDTGKDGETFLAGLYPATDGSKYTQIARSTKDCIEACNDFLRRFDVLADNVAHESKVGRVNLSPSIERQIRSDAYLVDQGDIDGAHWHFFASAVSKTLGPSKPVLDLLDELEIPYTIHIPA